MNVYITLAFNLNLYWITFCCNADFVNAPDDIIMTYFSIAYYLLDTL